MGSDLGINAMCGMPCSHCSTYTVAADVLPLACSRKGGLQQPQRAGKDLSMALTPVREEWRKVMRVCSAEGCLWALAVLLSSDQGDSQGSLKASQFCKP